MTRASMTRRSHLGANRSTKLDRPRAASKRKPYKILLEAVTQERKKLQSVLTYTAHAPPGYSYVPVGHPDLTEYCKDYCRKHNLDVHIVSAKPTSKLSSNPEKISHHVHRLGYHFPNEVVGQACDVLGYSIRNNSYQKNTQNLDTTRLARSLAEHGRRMQLRNSPAMEGESKDQIRAAIRDLFPKIPSYDLDEIVDHAFQEGTKRVGNAKELSLARRVQLAVAAHIRHNYTDYDRLLRVGSWTEARAKVEHVSLAKLKEWRDENDTDEVEETFREVIVLDDDESEADETLSDAAGSELSLEIVSSRAAGRDLQYDDFAHYPRVDAGNANGTPRRNHSRPEHLPSSNSLPARTVDLSGGGLFPRGHIQPLPSTFPRQYEPHLDSPFSRIEPLSTASATEPVVYGAPPRTQMRGADGRWYNLYPLEDEEVSRTSRAPPAVQYLPSSSSTPRYVREGYQQSPQHLTSLRPDYPSRPAPVSRRQSEQDIVLPSVERDPESVSSPGYNVDARRLYRSEHNSLPRTISGEAPAGVLSPKRKALPTSVHDAEDRYDEQKSNRIRPTYESDDIVAFPEPSCTLPYRHETHDYQQLDVRNRPRIQPTKEYETIDLTHSPIRPTYGRDRAPVIPSHSYPPAEVCSHSYAPASRGSRLRDSSYAYYEAPTRELVRTHAPEYQRVDERHIPRLYELVPIREEISRPHVPENGDYPQHSLHYGK